MNESKKVCELGERRIIELIQNRLDPMPSMPIQFGDDVSAYSLGKDKLAILKTDMLVAQTDVPRGMTLWQAARKAVVMNISDFAAKGISPDVLLVSLGLPKEFRKKDVEQIADGLNSGAREYGAYIIGGDTGEASDLIISISLFGTAAKNEVMLRSGAKAGDILAVTGFFGKTSAGLRILQDNLYVRRRIRNALVDSVLLPIAKLKQGVALRKAKVVTAAIDSSDGLAWSLYELAKASNVGFVVDKLPVAKEVKEFAKDNDLSPSELALPDRNPHQHRPDAAARAICQTNR
jgi:thiamine-monophosphate kinase